MSSIDFEVELTDVEREIQTTLHRFAAEEMRPAGEKLDKLHDPQAVGSLCKAPRKVPMGNSQSAFTE